MSATNGTISIYPLAGGSRMILLQGQGDERIIECPKCWTRGCEWCGWNGYVYTQILSRRNADR